MTEPDELVTAEERRSDQADEYGQWVAATTVTTPAGAVVYAPGHPVPASNVDEDGRVVLGRHQCDTEHPDQPDRCDKFNQPSLWSQPGAVRPRG